MIRLFFFLLVAAFSCKSSPFPDQRQWQLRTLEGEALPAGVETTLQFDHAEKTARGAAACNSYSGSYTLAGDTLRFGPLMSTKRFCEQMQWETRYFQTLERVRAYRQSNNRLELLDGARKVVAEME